ncbi:hypothetical protein CHLRE_16g667050v5 [Chlamydomonas reinhardtii]|uniref:Uncharacterized protein n=1 Tax=Chlamydomonas reinhardtii TaxID=3055 RepID=A0A2K3CUJ1_CHLRE|nr:uncharacterized protein CHLRE_16g667300v5 [Chlamydomonas reinhardtii]XP_042915881.1 uncharacterized protein CHLRE_16g667050v5 [Chlamydomonas reinhardtii]PNW71950.1 hypothetical protein CHLRE_16g667300v5 [Chlamydomonas reinhardtii]PNW71955.1 hypothetical protein CHLRE_16g667050v5 [Chlamydomonas reinhardtii]
MAPAAAVAAADAPPVQAPAADPPQAAPDEDLEDTVLARSAALAEAAALQEWLDTG